MKLEPGEKYESDIAIIHENTGASVTLAPPGRWGDYVDDGDNECWSIWCLRVPEEHRRKKIATQLLHRAIGESKSRGARAVKLKCRIDIVELYGKVGFTTSEVTLSGTAYMELKIS